MDSSLRLYKGKLKEAITLVTKMTDEKRSEAVDCWNRTALELQDIIYKTQNSYGNVSVANSTEGLHIDATNHQQPLYNTCIDNTNRPCDSDVVIGHESSLKQETPMANSNLKSDPIDQYHHDNLIDKSIYDCSFMDSSTVPVIEDGAYGLTQSNLNCPPAHDTTSPCSTVTGNAHNSALFMLSSYNSATSLSSEQQNNSILDPVASHTVVKSTVDNPIIQLPPNPQQITAASESMLTSVITSNIYCPELSAAQPTGTHIVKYMQTTNDNSNLSINVPKVELTSNNSDFNNLLINDPLISRSDSTDDIGNGQFDRGPKLFDETEGFHQQYEQQDVVQTPSTSLATKEELFTQTERPLQEIQPFGSNYYQPYISSTSTKPPSYKPLYCITCNEQLDDFEDLETHKQLHATTCDSRASSSGSSLSIDDEFDSAKVAAIKQEIIRATNSESPEVDVPAIASVSSMPPNTNNNNNNNNNNNTQHKCDVCGKSGFSTKGNLKRHLRAHSGEKPFKCEFCDSCFTEKKSLKIHVRRHTGEKPYKCEICGKLFSQTGVLQSHMALHLNERKFECSKCGKAFRQRSQLKLHLMRHDGVKRLECSTCKHKFLTKGDLERHYRIHTGERPYECKICNKTFTRQQSLNEHMNRHTGRRPYDCKYCDRTFSEMSACYKHAKTHKKEQLPSQLQQEAK